jgi:hypothetical protein
VTRDSRAGRPPAGLSKPSPGRSRAWVSGLPRRPSSSWGRSRLADRTQLRSCRRTG